MIRSFTPRLDILPAAQRQVWPALSPASQLGFVLYGGTAIALRIGHRPSIDFDFFTDRTLNKGELYKAFPFLHRSTFLQETSDTITVLYPGLQTEHHVKLSFFGSLTFGRVGEPEMTSDGIVQVAGLDDLMATKLKVILQRIEARDYQDIAAMIRAGADLSRGLAGARALYGTVFQPSESLKALAISKAAIFIASLRMSGVSSSKPPPRSAPYRTLKSKPMLWPCHATLDASTCKLLARNCHEDEHGQLIAKRGRHG